MQASIHQLHSPAEARRYFQDKLAFTIGPVELDRWIKTGEENLVIVDVREPEDFAKGHIPGAINLPRDQWHDPKGLSKDKTNVVYCYTQQCHLAANACVQFASMDFPVMELEGGFSTWKENDMEVEEEPTNRMRRSTESTSRRA